MRYVFFDIECANGGQGTICSFGYVVTDENFNEYFNQDILINPPGKFYLTGREGRPDVILAYSEEEFRMSPRFYQRYDEIKSILEGENQFVIGHSVLNDIGFLQKSCIRYHLNGFHFKFYDSQKMLSEYVNSRKQISLEKAGEMMEIEAPKSIHKSDEDARQTMLMVKAICQQMNVTLAEYISLCNACSGEINGLEYTADCASQCSKYTRGNAKRNDGFRRVKEGRENWLLKGSENNVLFTRFLDFVQPEKSTSQVLAGKKVSVSLNYEQNHYKEMINLIQMITNAGGTYVLKASLSDIFAECDIKNDDGTPRFCTRSKYVKEAIIDGASIKIVTFAELLATLGITQEELESLPAKDISYMKDDKYKKIS